MEDIEIQPKSGDTIRSVCGKGRISYHPEWSISKPWLVYLNGCAINAFATKHNAISNLIGYGCKFAKDV